MPPTRDARRGVFERDALVAFVRERASCDAEKAEKHAKTLRHRCAVACRGGAMTLDDVENVRALGLPRAVVDALSANFVLYTTKVRHESRSGDGTTTKMIVELAGGDVVEACVMRHAKGRTTLCVSSQVGCKMGCTFCATGTLGELGNLSAGEICEQLAHASRGDAVRNVVFMGMGEPLNNYRNVIDAIEAMTSDKGFGLSPAKITVSTVGVIPRMRTLRRDAPGTCLALSLHAPNQALRQKIVPTATAYKLEDLMATLDEHMASGPKMKTMIEYCVLGGVNDDEACARELGALLRGKEVIVNLIPLNPTDTPAGHVPPTREAVQKMLEILTSPEFDLFTTVRHEMGQDIAGACGQLALKTPDAPDMEDMIAPKKKTRAVAKKFKSSSSSTKSPEELSISSSVVPSRDWSRVECALVAATALSAVVLAVTISNRKARA